MTTSKKCLGCEEVKPLEDFAHHPTGLYKRNPRCKVCKNADWKRAYTADPEKFREESKWRMTKHKHGITREQYEAMFLAAGGRCAICRTDRGAKNRGDKLVIDHDAETGQIRGLLCHGCNIAIGMLQHDPGRILRAAAYLMEAAQAAQEGASDLKG